ncbi:hypothetical protein EMIT0P265_110149 [Pseudomonas zeae]
MTGLAVPLPALTALPLPNTPKSPVGASLLAKAVYQCKYLLLTHRYREQAHSYSLIGVNPGASR